MPLALGARPDARLEVVVGHLQALLAQIALLVRFAHGRDIVAPAAERRLCLREFRETQYLRNSKNLGDQKYGEPKTMKLKIL